MLLYYYAQKILLLNIIKFSIYVKFWNFISKSKTNFQMYKMVKNAQKLPLILFWNFIFKYLTRVKIWGTPLQSSLPPLTPRLHYPKIPIPLPARPPRTSNFIFTSYSFLLFFFQVRCTYFTPLPFTISWLFLKFLV